MPTVERVAADYARDLLPVLPPSPAVCAVCGTGPVAGRRCLPCTRAALALAAPADAVSAVALAVKGGRLARDLAAYKQPENVAARARVAALLWRWLLGHEACLAAGAGAAAFDLVTTVPSLSGRRWHPLVDVVGRICAPSRGRYRPLLVPGPAGAAPLSDRRFTPLTPCTGRSVLVVDDTWTSGAHAQSAASALHLAGAATVAVLAVGRHFHPDPPPPYRAGAQGYLLRAARVGWSWEACRHCRGAATRVAG